MGGHTPFCVGGKDFITENTMLNMFENKLLQIIGWLKAGPAGKFFRWWLEELRQAMPEPNRMKMKTTDGKHMPYKPDFSKIKPSVYKDSFQVQTPDGNTVDIDKEIVKMSKNQLMYNAVTQIIGKKFKGLSWVIKETK